MTEGTYRDGIRAILPLMPAILAFGASFGVLARAAGVDALAALVMSATTFAGSAQFAVVSVLGAGGTAAAAIGAAVLLNGRYVPMAVSASGAFRGGPVRRLLEAQLLVDESWALSRREQGGFDRRVLVGAGGLLYVGWVAGRGSACSPATASPTPPPSAWTRRSPRSSSPCSCRCSTAARPR
jgi:predicted branched-subunit amino acid permease